MQEVGYGNAILAVEYGRGVYYGMNTNKRREIGTVPQSRPDLSHLPEDDRLRVAVRLALGDTWIKADDPFTEREGERTCWRLGSSGFLRDDGEFVYVASDPLNDPAAWGALMERERIGLIPHDNGHGRVFWEWRNGEPWVPDSPGRAVCLAVLAKHGIPFVSPATARVRSSHEQ